MKPLLISVAVVCHFASISVAQTEAEGTLYQQLLVEGPESVEALEKVLAKPDEYSALVLFGGAAAALKENRLEDFSLVGNLASGAVAALKKKRLEDAGFLYYAGQLRARFDKECFPAVGEGGNSPFTAYAALSQTIGFGINPTVMDDPVVMGNVVSRLEKWVPKAPDSYDPGYEYKERKTEKEALDAALPHRKEFLGHMSDLCTLLKDEEYLQASRVVRAYNLGDDDKRPTKKAYDSANETMKRIEKAKGIKGFSKLSEEK